MRKLFLALVVAPSIAFAGLFDPSAGMEPDCTKKSSFAWCLMDLAKVADGIHDAPAGTMPRGASYNDVDRAVDTVGGVAEAVVGATDLARASNVMRLGSFGGAMSLMSALTTLGTPAPGTTFQTVTVVDGNDQDPVAVAATSVLEATKTFLGANSYTRVEGKPSASKGTTGYYFTFTGGEICGPKKCEVLTGLVRKSGTSKTIKVDTPAWYAEMTGTSSLQVTLVIAGALPVLFVDDRQVDLTMTAYGMSKHIPKGMFYYVPVTEKKPMATIVGDGKEYFFVKPAKD